MKRKMILSSGVLALLSLVGCGGGGGSTLVNPSLVVNWAERTRAINAPSSAQSVKITLDSPQPTVADVVWVINRGSNLAAFSQSYTSPEQVPSGAVSLRVELFADANAAGTEVGEGVLPAILSNTGSFETPTGDPITNIAIDRTIRSVSLGGATLAEGAALELSAAALDGQGGVVPVSLGSYRYSAVTGTTNIQLTPGGLLTGSRAGRSTITASVDGVTSPPAAVSVTPIAANYISYANVAVSDLAMAPASTVLYGAHASENRIVEIDSRTGEVRNFMNLPFSPSAIAVSADGSTMYVGSSVTDQVSKISVSSKAVLWTLNLGASSFPGYALVTLDLDVHPTDPNRWAVSTGAVGVSPPEDRVALYNGETVVARSAFGLQASRIFFLPDGEELVCFDASTSAHTTFRLGVSGASLVPLKEVDQLVQFFTIEPEILGNELVFSDGLIANATELWGLGNVALPGAVNSGWRATANSNFDRAVVFNRGQLAPITVSRLSDGEVLLEHPRVQFGFPTRVRPFLNGVVVIWDSTKVAVLRPVADF